MEIRDDHVEWAVVDRLRKMLKNPPSTEFNVTQTYALFVSILCWILQRIRSKECSDVDKLVANVLEKLQSHRIEDAPWSIPTDRVDTQVEIGPFPEFAGRTAKQFLIALRDAVAHGDARNVRPYHQRRDGKGGADLIGFQFECQERNRHRQIVWAGTITLVETDMRRIGVALADMFCEALRRSGDNECDQHFSIDAVKHVTEKAA